MKARLISVLSRGLAPVTTLVLVALAGGARADDACRNQAYSDYESAVTACDSDGGSGSSDSCRYDRDCGYGYQCASGRCVPAQVQCVRYCARYYPGSTSCADYADWCSSAGSCTTYCPRYYSGSTTCAQYADICRDYPVTCTMACARYYSGSTTCADYQDVCNG